MLVNVYEMETLTLTYFFLYVFLLHHIKGYRTVNHTEASTKCIGNGNLASYEYFDKHRGNLTLDRNQGSKLKLQDGESAWIMGYAEFSSFLSWYGCFIRNINEVAEFERKEIIHDNNLYLCSSYCLKHHNESEYIGLQQNVCFCLNYSDIQMAKERQACPDTKYEYSHMQTFGAFLNYHVTRVHVYRIHDKTELSWKAANRKLQQCVYATVFSSGDNYVSYYATHSCLTIAGTFFHGFICVDSMNSKLRGNSCQEYHSPVEDTRASCFVEEMSSWMDARNQCLDFGGKLISDIEYALRRYATVNKKYWTGMFRSFTIKDEYEHHYACLAVTRVNDYLILDPDNCDVTKRFLCNDNLTNMGVTKKTEYSEETETTTTTGKIVTTLNHTTAFAETSENKISGTDGDVYTYIGIGVGIFVTFIVAIIIVVRLFRKFRFRTQRQIEQVNTDNNIVYAEVYNLVTSTGDNEYSHNTESENETGQNNQKKKMIDSACRTIFASETTDYDKINLKYPNKCDKVENMNDNVYHQTNNINEPELYNVVSRRNKYPNNTRQDETYSKFKTEGSDYDSLNQNKEDTSADISKEVKGRTEKTYDTLK